MAKLPEQPKDSATVQAIYRAYEQSESRRVSRRLGASQIGKACERSLWYGFRHCQPVGLSFNGRMLRLFDTGHREEPRMLDDLRAIGCEAHAGDPATGEQFEFTDIAGHFVCKIDGACIGLPEAPKAWHACEFKTHSAKSFRELVKKGLEQAKPEHFAQLITGMALSGMKRGLYLAKNKDTDELYSERLRWEQVREHWDRLRDRAQRVTQSATPPERISDDRTSFACRFCDFNDVCHGSDPPKAAVPCKVSCRNCVHATPEMDADARWSCSKRGVTLTLDDQQRACPEHLFIPDLVTFADVVDAGYDPAGDWTEYQNTEGGAVWRQGKQEGQYSSEELTRLPGPLVGAGLVDEAKEALGAVVMEVGDEV